MDFGLSEAQELMATATRRFAAQRLAPGVSMRERSECISPEVMLELGAQGLLGVNVPAELGGSEAGVVAYALALRELAAVDSSVAVTMAVTNMVAEVITLFGSDEQRRQHVPKITDGSHFGGAFALSEPSCGSDAAALRTRAERRGDRWVLNGEKQWITTGDRAGVMVVWARTGGPGARGISAFLVAGGTPGVRAGKPEDKMGLRASHTVPLSFQDVELPAPALLGREGEGFRIAMTALDGGRIGIGAQCAGIGQAALAASVRYAQERQQFQKPLADFQAIQFKLADMATELDAAWLLTLRAARMKEQGVRFTREAAMAKLFSSEATNRVVREAVQIFGGYGYMEESGVARLFRDCRVTQIYEGTSEVQRLVIAREVLQAAGAAAGGGRPLRGVPG